MNRRLDPLALVGGLLFMTLGVLFLLDQSGRISLDAAVVIPIALIVLGLGAALSGRDN